MRYLIEAKTKKAQDAIENLSEKDFRIVDKYDPIVRLSQEVERIGLALRSFAKSGVEWEVFNYYLRGKGIPQAHIDAVMGEAKAFFKKVGILTDE